MSAVASIYPALIWPQRENGYSVLENLRVLLGGLSCWIYWKLSFRVGLKNTPIF